MQMPMVKEMEFFGKHQLEFSATHAMQIPMVNEMERRLVASAFKFPLVKWSLVHALPAEIMEHICSYYFYSLDTLLHSLVSFARARTVHPVYMYLIKQYCFERCQAMGNWCLVCKEFNNIMKTSTSEITQLQRRSLFIAMQMRECGDFFLLEE